MNLTPSVNTPNKKLKPSSLRSQKSRSNIKANIENKAKVQKAAHELIGRMKELGEKSLYFFGSKVIGNEYIVPHVHGEVAKWLLSEDRRRVRKFGGVEIKGKLLLVMLPRDSLKTTFLTSIYPLWRIVKDPNKRILIDSEARDLSCQILKGIKGIIDGCEMLRVVWGDLNGGGSGKTWNQEAISVSTRTDYKAKEDTIETSGIDVAITGRHYDIIFMDDLHSERNTNSKDRIEKVKEHIQYMMPLLEADGELIMVGTRWLDADAYEWVMSLKDDNGEPLFDTFIHPAYNEDGTAYYPERLSLGTLALKKATMNEALFSAQYLLDPIPESSAPLKKSNLQFIDALKMPLFLNKFMMCDTIGDKKSAKGDYFAVTTWGIEPILNVMGLCRLFLIDGLCGWFDTEQQIDAIVSLYQRTKPLEFGIEKSGMNTLHLHLENNLKSKGMSFLTTELKPAGRQKSQRILQLLPYSQNKMLYISNGCNEKFKEEFLYEWQRYPKSKRDDCLDSSAYIFDFMAKYPITVAGDMRRPVEEAEYEPQVQGVW